jgi:hypothetical protein
MNVITLKETGNYGCGYHGKTASTYRKSGPIEL